MAIHLGKSLPLPIDPSETQVICDVPELAAHRGRPWLRAFIRERVGLPARGSHRAGPVEATVPDTALARHSFLCGATGTGKSRLLLHLIREQLALGCSAVVIDPKGETADRLLAHVQAQGLAPGQVTLLDPRYAAGVPGWNPLNAGVPLFQAVNDFVALLKQTHISWGPRLQNLLTNTLLLVGTHDLSLYELSRLLVREEYRVGLLGQPVRTADPIGYGEVHRFFREEFGAWSRSEQTQAVATVLNKVAEILRSPFLRPLLCARQMTLDLAGLWRRPHLVLVRLDQTVLGEEGARLLAGLLAHGLLRTALRARGAVPVVLAIDELPMLERFVGGALEEIATVARSQRLRLLVACQHLAQLTESLRSALLANAAVQVYFRLGYADAKLVAASLAAGTEPRVQRLELGLDRRDRRTGRPELAYWRHPIRDPEGGRLRISPAVWGRLRWNDMFGRDLVGDLRQIAAACGVPRLYVRAADSGQPVELGGYVTGLSADEYWIEGPALTLVVAFPRPRLTGVQRLNEHDAVRDWTRRLQELPVQHAVLRLAAGPTGVMRVVNVATPTPAREQLAAFAAAVLRANGQSVAEIQATLREREMAVERLAGGGCAFPEEDDGSLI